MAYIQSVRTGSASGSGGTIYGSSTLTAYYTLSETDTTFSITQTSHGYSTPVYSGTTGDTFQDITFQISFEAPLELVSNISIGDRPLSDNVPYTINKTRSAQTLTLSMDGKKVTITVPAKKSYVVALKSPTGELYQNLTKWYNENLILPSASQEGYTCLGWATTSAKASAGEIDYAIGAAYTTNAATTLYGVFELTYTKPVISSLTAERCTAQGVLDDEGEYAKVTVGWSVYRSNQPRYLGGNTYPYTDNGSEVEVTVGTHTASDTSTDGAGTYSLVVGNGDYDQDAQYDMQVVLSDTQSLKPTHTTTVTGLLATSYFPIDFNAAGTAMGIFRPAPDNDEGVFLGKKITVNGTVSASNELLELDTTEPPDTTTTDGQIYQALKDLSWTDVIV